MVNPRLTFGIKIACSTFLICYLAITVDWASLSHTIYGINLRYYALSFILVILSNCFLAAKCSLLIEGTDIRHSFWGLVKINLISRFYAVLLPPALGPEMVRWFKITKNQSGKIFFMAASMFERAGFVLVSLAAGALFLYFSPSSQKIAELQDKLLPPLLLLTLLVLSLHVFFLSRNAHRWGGMILKKIMPPVKIKSRLLTFYDSFFLNNRSVKLVVGITGLSIGWHLFFLARTYLLFLALSVPLSFLDVAWMSSLVFLLQLLPVSLAGIGVREGALAFMFVQVGLAPEQGVAVGVLFFSQVLLLAGVGGLLELSETLADR